MNRLFFVSLVLALIAVFLPSAYALTGNPTAVKVVINSADKAAIKDLIVSDMLEKGFTIYRDSEYQLVFDKAITNFGGFLFMNLHTGQYPAGRLVFNSVLHSGGTLVTMVYYVVENPGTAREIQNVLDHKEDLLALQKYLFSLKSRIDGTPLEELMATLPKSKKKMAPGEKPEKQVVKSGIKTVDQEGRVTEIEKGSLAEVAGLKSGDLILEVNAKPVDVGNLKAWLSDIDTRIDAGRSVMVLYERDSRRDLVTLKKESNQP